MLLVPYAIVMGSLCSNLQAALHVGCSNSHRNVAGLSAGDLLPWTRMHWAGAGTVICKKWFVALCRTLRPLLVDLSLEQRGIDAQTYSSRGIQDSRGHLLLQSVTAVIADDLFAERRLLYQLKGAQRRARPPVVDISEPSLETRNCTSALQIPQILRLPPVQQVL